MNSNHRQRKKDFLLPPVHPRVPSHRRRRGKYPPPPFPRPVGAEERLSSHSLFAPSCCPPAPLIIPKRHRSSITVSALKVPSFILILLLRQTIARWQFHIIIRCGIQIIVRRRANSFSTHSLSSTAMNILSISHHHNKSAGGGQPNADESQEYFNNLLDEISSLLIPAQ